MASLEAEIDIEFVLRIGAKIKPRPLRYHFANAVGTFTDNNVDNVAVAKTGSGPRCISGMVVVGILGAPDRGYPSLRVLGRSLGELGLGDDGDLAMLGGVECKAEPGNPAANHKKVEIAAHRTARARLVLSHPESLGPEGPARKPAGFEPSAL